MAYIKIEKAIAEIDKGDLLVGNNAEWAKEILYRTPAADVEEVKHGEWLIEVREMGVDNYYRGICSLCGRSVARKTKEAILELPYCHCGALMDGGVKESDEG